MSRHYIWMCKLRQFLRLLKKSYEIVTNELNLQPENGNLSLATFKGLRAQKLQNSNRVTLQTIFIIQLYDFLIG